MITYNFHHKKHYKIQQYSKKILYTSLILTTAFALLEYIGGIISNSLALLGDSFHMFSDVAALGFSLIALIYSAKKPNKHYTRLLTNRSTACFLTEIKSLKWYNISIQRRF